ncbi:hypothetical protein HRI_001856000 [Hibiscus trionum]|uniref:Helicase protein MOM1 n=1 Tax=Hibiscus trionum TaxID=183268 RepID=A0A9W7HRX7_HIBTR|nr:hypothetical protein HRI_001856000 [Hibiscus trionum]
MKLNQFCGSSDVKSASGSEVRPSKFIHIVDDEATAYNDPINKARPFKEINSERASLECNLTAKSCGVDEQAVSRDSCLREQDSVDEIPNGGVQVVDPVTINSGDVTENALSMRCSDKYQISDGSKADTSARETVSLTDPLENLLSMEAPSSEKIYDVNTLRKVDCEIPLRESRTIISCEGPENFVSLEASSSVEIPDESNLSKVDGPVPLREPTDADSGEGQENLVSEEAFSSEEIPNEAALNNFDGEVHLGAPKTVSSGEGYESLQSLLVPSSEEVPGGTTSNTAERELPLSRPEAICSTEDQENSVSANRSIENQIPGEATLNVPDEEIPKSISEIATSCDGMDITVCTKSSTSKEHIPDTMACSMPTKEVSLADPETAPSEVLEGRSVQRENDGTSPNENDQQDGVLCTMSRESAPREPSSDLVSANVDSLPYASSEVHSGFFANNEMQNASRTAETSPFSGAIDVTCNVSNPDATVVELTEKMQQLRSSESTSNLFPPDLPSVSAVEHQSNNEGQTANQSSQVPRQPVVNHIELSNQDVLQPLDSLIDGLVSQASETRTFPVPSVSNGLPLWTVPAATSRTPMTSNYDPLQNEMERIKEKMEQTTKIHEDTKLQLKLECDKEIEEIVAQIRRQYDVKAKEKLAEYLLHEKELDVNYSKVHLNKILAEAFRSKFMDTRASGSAGAQQESSSSFLQQLFQLSSQQMVQQPSTAYDFPSTDSASSMQSVSPAVVNAQTMRPPLQVVNPSTLISGTPTRPPHISTISSSTVNPQIGTEIRAPAPHLQPFRPSSSFSPSSLPLHSGGMSSQQAQRNHPAASLSLHQSYVNSLAHRQASTTGPSGRNQHEIARGCTAPPNSHSPSLNVLTGVIDLSGASANPPAFLLPDCSSRLGTRLHRESHVPSSQSHSAQPSGGATDIVCLSDDD